MNNKKYLDFIAYINNPMSIESTNIIYASNNISFERCELYSDFIQSFLMLVFSTYMGDNLTNIEQRKNHFNWCWDKNINNFVREGVLFEGKKLYDYFYAFTLEVFYLMPDKNMDTKSLIDLWSNTFDMQKTKTNSEIDMLVELYQIFEKTLKIK